MRGIITVDATATVATVASTNGFRISSSGFAIRSSKDCSRIGVGCVDYIMKG
jgi:hypothetical protein